MVHINRAIKKIHLHRLVIAGVSTAILCFTVSIAIATALQSPNYQFNETSLGGLGSTGSQSTTYQADTSGGILGIGNSAAAAMQIEAGGKTTNDPGLAFGVGTSTVSFGSFSPGTTMVTTSVFEVANYTSYGYVVQALGAAPTNGSHTIAAMATTGPSQAGVEQFGINLVANTSPSSVGANPDHGQFGFGDPTTNYGTANNYRYVSGETIATGPKTSGRTTYTISYIVNVDSITPAGQYTSSQAIICTATF